MQVDENKVIEKLNNIRENYDLEEEDDYAIAIAIAIIETYAEKENAE